ncbi:MAG: hypothetical protein WDN04_28425 [Rhodospirillales bacterium]
MRWGEAPVLMGILNATPDSFANNGKAATIERGLEMIAQARTSSISAAKAPAPAPRQYPRTKNNPACCR